jgi:hypothetical protein
MEPTKNFVYNLWWVGGFVVVMDLYYNHETPNQQPLPSL